MSFPPSNSAAGKQSSHRPGLMGRLGLWIGLGAIALLSFHIIGVLVSNLLGLSPGSSNWPLALVLIGFLSAAGFFTSLQSLQPSNAFHKVYQAISAASSGAVLGVFVGAELSGQETIGSVVGLLVGSGLLFGLAMVADGSQVRFWRAFVGSAIALIGSVCSYAATFAVGAWFWAAIATQRIGLAILLGAITLLGLWLTRHSIKTIGRYLRT